MYIFFLAGCVCLCGGDVVQQSESAMAKGTLRYPASERQQRAGMRMRRRRRMSAAAAGCGEVTTVAGERLPQSHYVGWEES